MVDISKVRWNFNAFYPSPTAADIERDLQELLAKIAAFDTHFRGKLGTKLGDAYKALDEIVRLENKLTGYFFLAGAQAGDDAVLRKHKSRLVEKLSAAHAKHLTFFDIEVAKLRAEEVEQQRAHPHVALNWPTIEFTRENAKYQLAEDVEQTLTERAPFSSDEWDDFVEEMETRLTFPFRGKDMALAEILHVLGESTDPAVRAEAMQTVNKGLEKQNHPLFMARALNASMGEKRVDDNQRGYTSPMHARNIENRVNKAAVKALHQAVATTGAELAQRFYKLKTKLLGLEKMAWSDRNAPMPFADNRHIPWADAVGMVQSAFSAFSPVLGTKAKQVFENGWVDAPVYKGKDGGAFNMTLPLPSANHTYILINYQGSPRDVMTLAHEMGHAVHGLLASEKVGSLQWHAPMVYAETASVFGEMLTFEHILAATTEPKARLALLLDKTNDFMNTVVRQISFSELEQALHAKRAEGKLTLDDFTACWMDITKRFYSAEGDVFHYRDMENMWSYIGHFLSPFYVYAYAFGELFTQSLMAARANLGDRFEPLYLQLLAKGNTEGAEQLMEPFGLNPNDPAFWANGMQVSVEKWLTEAEVLAARL